MAAAVRAQLDALGATGTKITVTSDLDEYAIAALAASPVDAYGVGTSVVTGSGHPTAGMVYKLVARESASGDWIPVAKASTEKASRGGRKRAGRVIEEGTATTELLRIVDAGDVSDTVPRGTRALQVVLVDAGETDAAFEGPRGVEGARRHHAQVRAELPLGGYGLSRSDPAIPTVYQEGAPPSEA